MRQHRINVAALAGCQALLMTCNTLVIATSALVGLSLAPAPAYATVPIGLQFLFSMLTSMPASLFMRRFGRRAGFRIGAAAGVASGLLAALAIMDGSFALFCAAAGLYGVAAGAGTLYRFAAADSAPADQRARAISLVLAGGIVAGFVGPRFASLSQDWFWPSVFAGTYLSLAGFKAAALVLLQLVDIPPLTEQQRRGPARSLAAIAAQPVFLVAAACAMSGYGVMNLLMTSTPLAMQVCGHAFSSTATVIQWHVVGMFAPSFFTGNVIQRTGAPPVIVCGAGLMLACVAANLSGITVPHFWLGLLLLGVGWNFMFVGATTLLTEAYTKAEQAKAQGLNDFLVFATVALTASTSGLLHDALGWQALNIAVVPVVLAAAAGAALQVRRPAAA